MNKLLLFAAVVLGSSTIVALVVGEAVLRFAQPKEYYIRAPHLKKVFKPYRNVMPGISGESRFETNSRGFRGDELTDEHTFRILTVGGSTTECLYLDQFETWPYLLQKTLNENLQNRQVWVGNAGLSGITTRHHLIALQYLPLKEMKIDAVVFLVGINDFTRRLSQDTLYDTNFSTQREATALVNETFTGGTYPGPDEPFFKKTALYQLLWKAKGIVFPSKRLENIEQDGAGKIYVTWREHRRQASEIRNELPDLTSAIEEYARNINGLIDVARKESVRVIFMTQPTMWKSGLSEELEALIWLGGIGDFQKETGKPYYSVEALERGMENYNAVLRKICRERGIECLDVSPMLEKDTTVFFDDVHFNESGARKVSSALAAHIFGRDPFGGNIGEKEAGRTVVHRGVEQ
jgi:lysophospholipase L1-like esterase